MKQFSRVFALLLAACMLLTSLGVSSWADNPLPSDEPTSPPATEPVDGGNEEMPEDSVLTLPASLKTIEAQAFYGDSSLGEVVLPEGLEAIGAQAFAQSSLTKINLPASLGANAIADSAFDGVQDLTVTAAKGTAAYSWAVAKGLIEPTVSIDETNFPDEAFRSYVANNIDTDWDEELSAAEIAAVKSLYLSWSGVQSLTGLAVFTELEYLECSNTGAQGGNPLAELDVSGNKKLKTLICENNALETLDVSQNTALERLICIGNQLSTLDLSRNDKLVELRCGANPSLKALDLSNNRALQKLYCRDCDLRGLTLTNNEALKVLVCDGNANLGSLSLGTNLLLEELSCAGCGLSALDVSQNSRLIELNCGNNAIGSLNVANNGQLRSLHCAGCGLSALDVTQNTALSSLRCGDNANLTALTLSNMRDLTELHCENTGITSLDISSCEPLLICWRLGTVELNGNTRVYFYAGGHTSKGYIRMLVPAGATVSGTDPAQADGVLISLTSFPDAVLRAYVYDNFDEDQNYYLDADECAGAEEIRLSYRDVADLTGIENFPNLIVLECEHGFENDGRLTEVELSANTALQVLNLNGNPGLETLDVTVLPELRELCVGYTGLSSLNLTENTKLRKLLVDDCAFTSFDLSRNELLEELDCCGNEGLTALDISHNPTLVKLYRLGGRTPDWCPPDIAEGLIAYTGGDGTLVLDRSVTVNAGNVVCLAALTVEGIRRYETQRVDKVYERYNGNGEIIQRIPFEAVDCAPDSVTVTLSNEASETFTDLWSAAAWVKKQLNLSEDVYTDWKSGETPWYRWSDGTYTATAMLGGLETDFTVEILEDPVVSVSIQYLASGLERYEFDREKRSGYDDGNGWVEQEWYRIDAWPRDDSDVTVSVWLRNGSSYSGTADEVRDAMQRDGLDIIGWHSDETPQNLWQSGNTYTAWLDVGGMSTNYEVSVLANPLTSLSVDAVAHTIGVAEQWNPDVGWVKPVEDEYIDCTPDTIWATAEKDGEALGFCGNEGEFHSWLRENLGVDPEMHYAFVDPPEEWATNASYQARFTLGPEDEPIMTADYSVMLFENPIKRIRIDPQSFDWDARVENWSYRVPGDGPFGGWWVPSDECWLRLDVTPEITVTLSDGTTMTDNAYAVFKALNANLAQPALHFSVVMDETPTELWYGGEHEAYFVIGTVGYYYPLTVNGPIESVSVPDVTRHANCLSDWTDYYDYQTDTWHHDMEQPWRIEAHPDSITITLKEDYSFSDGTRSKTFTNTMERGCLGCAADELEEALGMPFTLRWNSNETPNARWQPGDEGDAWVDIQELWEDGIFHYTVNVTEEATRVALLADGPVDDAGFNQAGFDAARAFCEENELDFDWFTLDDGWEPTELARFALDLGSNVIVAVGFTFSSAVAELAPDYPDARFILLDEVPTDEEHGQIPANAVGVTYREEQAGYMAGWAAVKLGYHKLGFLGGMATDSDKRYGIGFVQGAQAAATALGINDLSIKYAYSGTFRSENWITEAMNDWYADETELVFACGGGVWDSVAQAAASHNGKIIGVDVDQAAEIDGRYGEGLTVTSAMKGLGASVTAQLNAVLDDGFAGGTAVNLGIVSANPNENGVQLAPSTQFGAGFTRTDYEALVASMAGNNPVDDNITLSPASFAPGHVTLCDIQPEVVENGGE